MALETIDSPMSDPSTKLDLYRQAVWQFLTQYTGQSDDRESIETQPIFDRGADRYLILNMGWRGQERVYGVLIHLEIRAGKVWIQRNQTEREIEAELMALGIPQEDIVRGLIPPEYRVLAGLESGV
ncbi:MAG: XisI protein [Geitlerinemataceae cyanobacterium]